MRKQIGRAFTLVEMMLALVIISVVSVAVTALLAASGNSSSYVTSTNNAVWQVDNACRRMTYNLRMASTLDSPAGTTQTNTFTVHTQQDAGNGNATYQVVYAVDGNNNLTENDARFGTNTLVSNVTSFTVVRVTASAPTTVQISITAGTKSPVTRTFVVLCRNL
jgi:prepilin-type N-terminal cleavage/methylation domain-containing protein